MAGGCVMSPLRQIAEDYLKTRRALGFSLQNHGQLVLSFIDHLEQANAATVDVASGAAISLRILADLCWGRLSQTSTIGPPNCWWAASTRAAKWSSVKPFGVPLRPVWSGAGRSGRVGGRCGRRRARRRRLSGRGARTRTRSGSVRAGPRCGPGWFQRQAGLVGEADPRAQPARDSFTAGH